MKWEEMEIKIEFCRKMCVSCTWISRKFQCRRSPRTITKIYETHYPKKKNPLISIKSETKYTRHPQSIHSTASFHFVYFVIGHSHYGPTFLFFQLKYLHFKDKTEFKSKDTPFHSFAFHLKKSSIDIRRW